MQYALHALGHPIDPRLLLTYAGPEHFATFPGERTVSVSTNAHVLEVLLAADAAADGVAAGIRVAAGYLLGTQRNSGCWVDKWHASPYYATACAVLALAGRVPNAAGAVRRAAGWVRDTQRPDGSWGVWLGTREETAYAMQVLLVSGGDEARRAAAAGARYLVAAQPRTDDVPLWHGKELYEPRRIVDGLVDVTVTATVDPAISVTAALRR